VLAQAHRVLSPGGVLALDTPNAALTRVQQPLFIDPDHKHEYTHREMVSMLEGSGFRLERAHGINYGGGSVATRVFDSTEVSTNRGLYDEIEECYLLAYVCRRPRRFDPVVEARRVAWKARPHLSPLRRAVRGLGDGAGGRRRDTPEPPVGPQTPAAS
jgi:hypothetical protein